MSAQTYLVFGDLHGRILPAFRLATVWAREHATPVAGILQVGDLGYFPDISRLDKATLRHAKDDPTELGAQGIIAPNQLADAVFDDARLETQRVRILDRLATLGQAARVLYFPNRTAREVTMPGASGSRRWVSVAAAAGLIIGLVAGQLLRLVPWEGSGSRRDAALTVQVSRTTTGVVPATSQSTCFSWLLPIGARQLRAPGPTVPIEIASHCPI